MATDTTLAKASSFTQPDDFTQLSNDQLDEVFRAVPPGEIPVGEGEGAAIIAPGTEVSKPVAHFIHIFGWKGKVFERDAANPGHGSLKNRLFITGTHAVIADVYKGTSWLDGKECIVLDYSKTSLVAHWIRDEIREVRPGLFLGQVYWGTEQNTAKKLIHFALKF